jgi:hypothetical protein
VGWRQPGYTGQFVNQETKCEVHFYGITGQKLAGYSCGYHDADGGDGTFYWSLKGYNVYFVGHLVQSTTYRTARSGRRRRTAGRNSRRTSGTTAGWTMRINDITTGGAGGS